MNETRRSPLASLARLLGWLLLPLAVGAVSGFLTSSSVDSWYQTIAKPSFNPPGWIFGPVWTVLYLMIGLAAYLAFRPGGGDRGDVSKAKVAFFVQLVLNGLWSLIFFGMQRPGWALIEIALLWVAIAWTVSSFARLSKIAAWLLAPYWVWVSFATVLNAAIWWLNR